MARLASDRVIATAAAVAVALLAPAGAAGEPSTPPAAPARRPPPARPAGTTARPAGTATGTATGTIRGTVRFDGAPPERVPPRRQGDPYCARAAAPAGDVVVTDGKLRDALVRVALGALPRPREVPPPAVLDQRGCEYVPRVLGLVAGQRIVVRNSDGTFHNVHGTVAGAHAWNHAAPAGDPPLTVEAPPRPGDVLEIGCDVHPWMRAYAVVHDHAAFAVTGDDGAFALTGLAPGAYTLEAWHPVLGTTTARVTVVAGEPRAAVQLLFRAPARP